MTPVERQVRVSEIEAGFALAVTLAVCVRTEWAHGPNGVAMAIVLPVAMAFSVHGLHNAAGLGWWNLVYIPLRVTALLAGLAYSYSHYLAMLPADPLLVAGRDIRWLVAVVVELLTVSALMAHQGHSSRLHRPASPTVPVLELVDFDPPAGPTAAVADPTDRTPTTATRFVPLAGGVPAGASSPVSNGAGSTNHQAKELTRA
ncbi:MAG: hypothetical protein OEV40_21380 [Acidimicrobiia bacterium]|nr:hypothetical protein [Acidimicrobiia bacterium]